MIIRCQIKMVQVRQIEVDLEAEQIPYSEAGARIIEKAQQEWPGFESYQIYEWDIVPSEEKP